LDDDKGEGNISPNAREESRWANRKIDVELLSRKEVSTIGKKRRPCFSGERMVKGAKRKGYRKGQPDRRRRSKQGEWNSFGKEELLDL